MKFFKRIAGLLGFSKDEQVKDTDRVVLDENQTHQQHLPRKGFSVPVQVSVDTVHTGPVLIPTIALDGGVQGLRWYADRLRVDDEGDIADEFLDEVLPEMKTVSMTEDNKHRPLPRFELKGSTLPAKVRNQVVTPQGKILHRVEHQGRLQWV